MEELPPEIVERLLWFLDGASLARANTVCKRWHTIIKRMEEIDLVWKACCMAEISPDVIAEMLGNVNPVDLIIVEWLKLYKRWLLGTRITTNHRTKKFSTAQAIPMTCIKLTGNCVISGHRNGSIHLWDAVNGEYISPVCSHQQMVIDMVVVDLLREAPYTEHFLDHHVLISGGKDYRIQVNSLYIDEMENRRWSLVLNEHGARVECVRIFSHFLLASDSDNSISIWLIEKPLDVYTRPHIEFLRRLPGPPGFLRWVGFWNNRISCLCLDAKVWLLPLSDNEWTFRVMKNRVATSDVELVITHCYMFRDKIAVFLTVDRHICITVDGETFRAYPTLRTLQSYVVAVSLVGNLLAIGTESGVVFLYKFKSKNELTQLSLENPTWKSHVSEASILSISIEAKESGLQIAVATADSVSVVKWKQKSDFES